MEVTTIVTREKILERGREARAYFRKPLMKLYPSGVLSFVFFQGLRPSYPWDLASSSSLCPCKQSVLWTPSKEVTVPFARSPVPSYGLAHSLVWHVVLPIIPALRQGAHKFEYRPHSKFWLFWDAQQDPGRESSGNKEWRKEREKLILISVLRW